MDRLLKFWREFASNPRQMGSILPSSRRLGAAMAAEVLKRTPGYVIELGAGTGSITHSLLEIRESMVGYSVLEKSPQLAWALSKRFPHLHIEAGCASELATIKIPDYQPLTVVSSLPFRVMESMQTASILNAIDRLSKRKAGFRLIQYSYLPVEPFQCRNVAYTWRWTRTVLFNVPPATVWELSKPAA